MEAVAEGLWGLADYHEKRGEVGKAIKCLEAVCQSNTSLLPILEVKTRLRIASFLLHHTYNLSHAKFHLERSVPFSSPFPHFPLFLIELRFRILIFGLSMMYLYLGSWKNLILEQLFLFSSSFFFVENYLCVVMLFRR